MRRWPLLLPVMLLGVLSPGVASAASSINTSQPVQGAPYDAAPIRQNFGAAASDIGALQSLNAGASPPAAPSLGTLWLETPQSGTTYYLKIWVPSANAWLTIGAMNASAGQWEPPIGGGSLPSIVSAATTNLGSVPQAAVYVTGSQSIASFGSSTPAGQAKLIIFTGAPTLVYNATFMILPGNANYTIAAGQSAVALSLGSGAWKVLFISGVSSSGPVSISGAHGVQTSPDPITLAGVVELVPMASNTLKGNPTAVNPDYPIDVPVPSCADTGGQHLNWVAGAGFACGTSTGVSITATAPIVVTPDPTTGAGDVSITIPAADLLGGAAGTFTSVSVGTNLDLTAGTLSVKPCGATTIGFTDCVQTWTAFQTFGSVGGSLGNDGAVIAGTSYTLNSGTESDCGRMLVFTSNSSITLTTDPTSPVNCAIGILQLGTGIITIADGGGATHHSRLNFTGSAGQYGYFGLVVYQNSGGSSAVYVITGDGA